jgi:hypothetical protein
MRRSTVVKEGLTPQVHEKSWTRFAGISTLPPKDPYIDHREIAEALIHGARGALRRLVSLKQKLIRAANYLAPYLTS